MGIPSFLTNHCDSHPNYLGRGVSLEGLPQSRPERTEWSLAGRHGDGSRASAAFSKGRGPSAFIAPGYYSKSLLRSFTVSLVSTKYSKMSLSWRPISNLQMKSRGFAVPCNCLPGMYVDVAALAGDQQLRNKSSWFLPIHPWLHWSCYVACPSNLYWHKVWFTLEGEEDDRVYESIYVYRLMFHTLKHTASKEVFEQNIKQVELGIAGPIVDFSP